MAPISALVSPPVTCFQHDLTSASVLPAMLGPFKYLMLLLFTKHTVSTQVITNWQDRYERESHICAHTHTHT